MTFVIWTPNTNKLLHQFAVRSAVTSENWNPRADESLHKVVKPTTIDGETSKFATPSPVQKKGFNLIQQGRDIIQMGRNLFVKEAVPTASNTNFIYQKKRGESEIQVSEPIQEINYFQEDTINVEINPEDEIKKYRFSDDGRQLVVMTDDNGNQKLICLVTLS